MEYFTIVEGARVQYERRDGIMSDFVHYHTTNYNTAEIKAEMVWLSVNGVSLWDYRQKQPINAKLHVGGNI